MSPRIKKWLFSNIFVGLLVIFSHITVGKILPMSSMDMQVQYYRYGLPLETRIGLVFAGGAVFFLVAFFVHRLMLCLEDCRREYKARAQRPYVEGDLEFQAEPEDHGGDEPFEDQEHRFIIADLAALGQKNPIQETTL